MVRTGNDGDSTRSSSKMTTTTTISGDLCKKIVSNYHGCDKRIPNETADAIGEVLRLFIVEARARASIEVSLEFGDTVTVAAETCVCGRAVF